MSRGEELREKFRKKAEETKQHLESPYGQFNSALLSYCNQELGVWAQNEEFSKKMFSLYEEGGSPDLAQWFSKNLTDLFKCDSEPPKWVSDSSWCFHEGNPMTFVGQITASDGMTYYVFEGKYEGQYGEMPLFKMLAQDEEGSLVLKGEIKN